jgi:putative redox protein
MPEPLKAKVEWTSRMHFEGRAGFAHDVPIDHGPPLGTGEGIKPTELTLMSLAACSGQTVISLLEKMRQSVTAFTVRAEADKREDHPQIFTAIRLNFRVEGTGLDKALVEKAVRLSEEKYCPVWAMLKPAVPITSTIDILSPIP